MTDTGPEADLSFLAPPGALADWRMVLSYEAAAKAGVLDALPGSLTDLAARCDLDEKALRTVLTHLKAYGVLTEDDHGHYAPGPTAPTPPHDDILLNHAATIHRWAALLGPRLHDRTATPAGMPTRPPAPSRVPARSPRRQRATPDPTHDRRVPATVPARAPRTGPGWRPRRALAGTHAPRRPRHHAGPA